MFYKAKVTDHYQNKEGKNEVFLWYKAGKKKMTLKQGHVRDWLNIMTFLC